MFKHLGPFFQKASTNLGRRNMETLRTSLSSPEITGIHQIVKTMVQETVKIQRQFFPIAWSLFWH